MIDFISSWAQGIVVAVIIATIIEMILPNGNSKKYIKMIIGVYVVFNIITPIISKVTKNNFDLSDIVSMEDYSKSMQTYNTKVNKIEDNNNSNVKEIYQSNLKKDISNKLKEQGYIVNYINVEIQDNEQYTINKISINVTKKNEEISENTNNENSIKDITINVINISVNNKIDEENKDSKEKANLSDKDKNKIRDYISNTYNVNKDNININ